MAGYALIGSYSTIQVLSPTLTNPVEYCTIQTSPSGVIASKPVQEDVFRAGGGGSDLQIFADAIEQVMADDRVVAGVGEQTIDANGLLADNVVFTVQYASGASSVGNVTAQAVVPVGLLDFTDGQIGRTLLAEVDAIITEAYNALKNAAGTGTVALLGQNIASGATTGQ